MHNRKTSAKLVVVTSFFIQDWVLYIGQNTENWLVLFETHQNDQYLTQYKTPTSTVLVTVLA